MYSTDGCRVEQWEDFGEDLFLMISQPNACIFKCAYLVLGWVYASRLFFASSPLPAGLNYRCLAPALHLDLAAVLKSWICFWNEEAF